MSLALSSSFLLPVLLHSGASRTTDIFRIPILNRRFDFVTNFSSDRNGYEHVRKAKVYEDETIEALYGVDVYFENANDFIRPDGGPPRWFSPLVNGGRCDDDAPLLLYLPGSLTFLTFWILD